MRSLFLFCFVTRRFQFYFRLSWFILFIVYVFMCSLFYYSEYKFENKIKKIKQNNDVCYVNILFFCSLFESCVYYHKFCYIYLNYIVRILLYIAKFEFIYLNFIFWWLFAALSIPFTFLPPPPHFNWRIGREFCFGFWPPSEQKNNVGVVFFFVFYRKLIFQFN